MKKVTKIEKLQNVTSKKQKLRVAAYCRVSTSNDVDYVLYCICAVLYCSNIFFGILNKLPCRINVMCN